MQKIQVLPDALASQVAAGEVVERPSSVVKELVENSIDSGARRIDILVRLGGTALIKIVDDGCGMGREDAVLSLERHATSKLRTKEDLAAITTMGFRGEALPSIASVSRFTLTTREHGALSGTQVVVDGGKLLTVSDAGEAPGTQIEVRNLFYNVPARRKFLRSENTEFSHIEQQVRVQALAHPEIAFSLTRDERLLFHLPGGGGLGERIAGLAGVELAGQLLEVPRQSAGGVTAFGFIGEGGTHRSSRAMLFTFLNRRPVESPVFNYALRGAYAEALPRGQWPVVFLFMEIDPQEVDVNVHPAKREVRFRDGLGVQSSLMEMLSGALRKRQPEPGPSRLVADAVVRVEPPLPRWSAPARQPVLPEYLPRTEAVVPPPVDTVPADPSGGTVEVPPPTLPEPSVPRPLPFTILNPLGDHYWLLKGDEGLVVLDHRAAWERILFEEARARAVSGGVASQQLLTPITVALSPREYDFLRPHLKTLRLMGVGAEDFGVNTVIIDSLPPFYTGDGDAPALISALIADLQHAGDRAPQRRLDDEAVAAAVARQAARLQPPDTAESVTRLTIRLLACDMPYCCPEGRPTLIQISFQELARKFGKR
ncbi:MAG TPA: DNA mismatch repair endonuclease MutL [Verrucomicrobiales bacterium]|nr:DNA mismatch repair endonuclease MutL [Verrucomicrobiales bacterium]